MAEAERPTLATVAILLMLATGGIGIALGVYFAGWGGSLLAGLLYLLLGIAYALGGRALWSGQSWGWGAGVFAGVLFLVFGGLLIPLGLIPLALALVVIILLYRVREYYGMVRYSASEEERRKTALRTSRMTNPGQFHCPHCGSTALWIAPDGSAWCENCKRGMISLVPAT